MVEGVRNKTSALQRLARWPTHSPSSSMTNWTDSKKHGASLESTYFQPIHHDNLVQGSLYIMKVKIVTISLFEGWNDDMCCFSVLRSDTGSMRWSEARYLPGDFDAFDAFDDAGNPPVYFWTRYLRIQVPVNWFSLFEEARRRQRAWTMDIQRQYIYQQQQQQDEQQQQIDEDEDDMLSFPAPPSSISSLPLNDNDGNDNGGNDITHDEDKQKSPSAVYSNGEANDPPPPLSMGTSFSQLRHGAPTIFSDSYTTAPATVPSPFTGTRPAPPPSPSTMTAAAAFPSSYSSSSSIHHSATKPNRLSSNSNTNDQQLIYSPTPATAIKPVLASNIATTPAASTVLSDSSHDHPSSPSSTQLSGPINDKDTTMSFLQTDYHSATVSRHPHKTAKPRRSLSIKSPTSKKQQQRKSVLGLF
ncbi:hypothetical protein [Absidia glauca]|uniref:Uncharacterized protein n=1 Tax=Absidia glauca TaxID=4829 RepID=A0A163JYC7_ABSGL|nr:hypothetical protein [Absidia glauca]